VDHDIAAADDYVTHVKTALDEAAREIDTAAMVFIETDAARAQLGRALGHARNALSRARHDIAAHEAREQRFRDRDSAQRFIAGLSLGEDSLPYFAVTVVPLPLEEERIPPTRFDDRAFQNDFNVAITRFNGEERRRLGYLMEVPGSMSGSAQIDHLAYVTYSQGAKEPSQYAWLFSTGALVFKHRLHAWVSPPVVPLDYMLEDLRATVRFVLRLYEEYNIVPRAIALHVALANADDFRLMVRTAFAQEQRTRTETGPIVAPKYPIIVSLRDAADVLSRVEPSIAAALRAPFA